MIFKDRSEAGLLLSQKLSSFRGSQSLILGLARGGVAIAAEVGHKLNLPFDVLIIKKIPSPGDPELAVGALAPDGVSFINWKFAHSVGADEAYIKSQITNLNDQIKKKTLIYRDRKPPLNLKEKTVILVDDGAATGASIEAAVKWSKRKHAKKIIVALPVAPKDLRQKVKPEVNELIILETPKEFVSVGQFYKNFPQISDEKVIELLRNSYQQSAFSSQQ